MERESEYADETANENRHQEFGCSFAEIETGSEKGDQKERNKTIGNDGTRAPTFNGGSRVLVHLLHGGRECARRETQICRNGGDRKETVGGIRFVGKHTLVLILGGLVSCSAGEGSGRLGGADGLGKEPGSETMGTNHLEEKECKDTKRQVMGQKVKKEGAEEDGIGEKRVELQDRIQCIGNKGHGSEEFYPFAI